MERNKVLYIPHKIIRILPRTHQLGLGPAILLASIASFYCHQCIRVTTVFKNCLQHQEFPHQE